MPFRWIFDEGQLPQDSLDGLDHEAWVDFVFNHPLPKKDAERWYACPESERYYFKDAEAVLGHVTRLFRMPEGLLARFSAGQVIQGFWSIIAAFELPDLLEDKGIDLEPRLACIRSIPAAYERLLSRSGFEKVAFSYWDPLTYGFSDAFGRPSRADLLEIHDAMFESLSAILNQEPKICFISAARGLGQLHHEHGAASISAALAARSDLSIFEHAYGVACMRGEVSSQIPLTFA
jgi:hypothetical protein